MLGFQVGKERTEWIIENVRYKMENVRADVEISHCRMWGRVATGHGGRGDVCGVVALFAPITDHSPPVRGSVISALCSNFPGKGWFVHGLCCLLGQAVDSPLFGDNEEKKAAHSLGWCNPRIIKGHGEP